MILVRVSGNNQPTAGEAIQAIADLIGADCVIPSGLPNSNYQMSEAEYAKGSYRDMLGYFAGLLGCNAMFDRNGALTVKPYQDAAYTEENVEKVYTISRAQQYLNGFKKSFDDPVTINSIVCTSPEQESDLTYIPRFRFGFIEVDNTDGSVRIYHTLKPPNDTVVFYSLPIPIIPGETYTIKRSGVENSDTSVRLLGKDTPGISGDVYWEDNEFAVYSHKMRHYDLE